MKYIKMAVSFNFGEVMSIIIAIITIIAIMLDIINTFLFFISASFIFVNFFINYGLIRLVCNNHLCSLKNTLKRRINGALLSLCTVLLKLAKSIIKLSAKA